MRGGGPDPSALGWWTLAKVGMASDTESHLISVITYDKYALLGVLGFDAKGGHLITYENT